MQNDYNKSATKSAIFLFKEIPDHPRYYADFNGNIYSAWHRELRRLKPTIAAHGYLYVRLYDALGNTKRRYVHQLVLETFGGARPEGLIACHHPDPTKSNNHADNLVWQTRAENWADCIRDGGIGDRRRKLDADQVREIRKLSAESGMSNAAIARQMGVGPDNIRFILNGLTWAWVA